MAPLKPNMRKTHLHLDEPSPAFYSLSHIPPLASFHLPTKCSLSFANLNLSMQTSDWWDHQQALDCPRSLFCCCPLSYFEMFSQWCSIFLTLWTICDILTFQESGLYQEKLELQKMWFSLAIIIIQSISDIFYSIRIIWNFYGFPAENIKK